MSCGNCPVHMMYRYLFLTTSSQNDNKTVWFAIDHAVEGPDSWVGLGLSEGGGMKVSWLANQHEIT